MDSLIAQDIIHNLDVINQRIRHAASAAQRRPEEIQLLLAAKTVSADKLRFAAEQGYTLMGQNKVQEGTAMNPQLADMPVNWHFIGHLQTNKIKEVLKWASCIQTLDRIELAHKLDQRLQLEGRTLDVMIQVNTSGEASKSGTDPGDALELARAVHRIDTLRIRGLMTIGALTEDETEIRRCYRLLRKLQTDCLESGIPAQELSMGMSADLELAIEEGATIVRVGSAVFGQRVYKNMN